MAGDRYVEEMQASYHSTSMLRLTLLLGFAIQLIYFSGEDQVQSYWMAQPLSGRKTAGKTVQSEPPELKPIKKSLRGFLVSRRSNSVER